MLDSDHRCSLADDAAARWGRDGAVFVRSSASHVFLAHSPGAPSSGAHSSGADSSGADSSGAPDLVLRMAPLGTPQAEAVTRSATTAETLVALGAPVPPPVRSLAGLLVEEVDGMVVTALPRVPGTTYDDDELTPDLARLWGRTLARFHETGYVHGDPEPDNLVVDGDAATFVDLDDAGAGDPVADIAFALRAWTPPGGSPDLSEPVTAAFLAGYRELGGLTEADLGRLPEAAREVAHRTLASYLAHLGSPADPDWPPWAARLHATIAARAAELENALA